MACFLGRWLSRRTRAVAMSRSPATLPWCPCGVGVRRPLNQSHREHGRAHVRRPLAAHGAGAHGRLPGRLGIHDPTARRALLHRRGSENQNVRRASCAMTRFVSSSRRSVGSPRVLRCTRSMVKWQSSSYACEIIEVRWTTSKCEVSATCYCKQKEIKRCLGEFAVRVTHRRNFSAPPLG